MTEERQAFYQEHKQYWVEQHRRKAYGLTPELYEELYASQAGCCAICGSGTRRLNVDHDHTCCPGKRTCGECVRGLVCNSCNIKLSGVEDLTFRESALRYLERF